MTLHPSLMCFFSRHLAERVDDIYYQRPADNWGLQIKYLTSRADERGGRMSKDEVEIVYNGVGMYYDIYVQLRKNCDFSVYDVNGKVKERPLHAVTDHLTRFLKMAKFTPRYGHFLMRL